MSSRGRSEYKYGEEDRKSVYRRQGLEALFTYTPFKIIYMTKDAFVMSFWCPSGFKCYYHDQVTEVSSLLGDLSKLSQFRSKLKQLKELWSVGKIDEVLVEDHNVNLYRVFKALKISKNSDCYVLLVHSKVHDYLTGSLTESILKEYLKKHGKRVLAEFSYASLNESPAFCRLGLVLITHRKRCPLEEVCPFKHPRGSVKPCTHFITRYQESYFSIYKVMPIIAIKISVRDDVNEVPILALSYGSKPLMTLYYVSPVDVIAYYEGIYFKPKKYEAPFVFLPFRNTLGVRLFSTSSLKIKFDDATLDGLIKSVMQSGQNRLKNWLLFKARLLKYVGIEGSRVRRLKGLIPWLKMENIVMNAIKEGRVEYLYDFVNNNFVNKDLDDDDRRLLKFILVHSLAHVILQSLLRYTGLGERELSYIIELEDNSIILYVFEAVSGGYGFLRQLSEEPQKLYDIILESLIAMGGEELKTYCTTEVKYDSLERLLNDLDRLGQQGGSDKKFMDTINKLKLLIESLWELYSKLGINLHAHTLYFSLAKLIPGRYKEKLEDIADRLLALFYAFDGNVGCGFLEEGCTLGPFIEPISISYSLLEFLGSKADKFKAPPTLRVKAGTLLRRWLPTAIREVKIATSNINVYSDLTQMLRESCGKGVKIKILLGKNAVNDKYSIDSVDMLLKDLGSCVQVRLNEGLHAKMIVIDDIVVIHGSFNLTKSGLEDNIEEVSLTLEPEMVKKLSSEFDELWDKASPVNSGNDLRR
jgi:hypothetical protein